MTADHVLFDECMIAFRNPKAYSLPGYEDRTHSYLLLDFHLNKRWDFANCTIHPTEQHLLSSFYGSFISRLDNPEGVGPSNVHLFGTALASIVSFVTGRLCESPRDDYVSRRGQLNNDSRVELAILHPVLLAGPGSAHTRLSSDRIDSYCSAISSMIEKLLAVTPKTYVAAMQAIRLVHLSLLNKRRDFGLAYLLIVSAIETIAQEAITRDEVKDLHPLENRWRERAKRGSPNQSLRHPFQRRKGREKALGGGTKARARSVVSGRYSSQFLNCLRRLCAYVANLISVRCASTDQEFGELYRAYKEARGREGYLKRRYVAFIERFAPVSCWEEVVRNPLQDLADYVDELGVGRGVQHVVSKQWFEKYPGDLSPELLRKLLEDSYTHRSLFVHRGKQPPHREPVSFTRFFQVLHEIDGSNMTQIVLPNYELILGIAQRSITTWIESQ